MTEKKLDSAVINEHSKIDACDLIQSDRNRRGDRDCLLYKQYPF